MTNPVLSVCSVHKTYGGVKALNPTSFELAAGELVVLTGPSGSGKSTLMMIAGGWETPDGGEVRTHPPLAARQPAELSWQDIGFVPQSISLFDELTIAANLSFAAGQGRDQDHLERLLEDLDIAKLARRLPAEVSRGEQQRAAVGRALAARGTVILADEPTSHQDRGHTEAVLETLRAAAGEGAAVLLTSHDPVTRGYAHREIALDRVVAEAR